MPLRDIPEPTGPLAERTTAHGHRRLKLNQDEKDDFKEQAKIQQLVHMMLTLEDGLTYGEMAEELGITVPMLKNLKRTEYFQEYYNEFFMQLGTDPRVQVTQARIVELLPLVFTNMKKGLSDADVPWTARTKIMEKVLELSGIEKPQNVQNDRKELEKFLLEKGEDNIQITIPGKYMEAMRSYKAGEDSTVVDDVIEGEFSSDVRTED